MASTRRARTRRGAGGRYSENTVGRKRFTGDKAGRPRKPLDVFDFPENSSISSVGRMSENEKDEDPYESFEPPLHSTAIDSDEAEPAKLGGPLTPSAPPGEAAQGSSHTSDTEESEKESVKTSAKKRGRRLQPISDEYESCSEGAKPAGKIRSQQQEATSSSEPSEPLLSAMPAAEKETPATESPLKIQKKKVFHGKRKKSRSEAKDPGISDDAHIWCLKGKRSSDIVDLDVVLSAFEKVLPEYKQNIESKICKEAIDRFHSSMKEELIKMLAEVQMLKTLRRRDAKMISDIEKKRQRLIEVQDELLCLEPQLKQLQAKYDELKERRSSLRDAADFLSSLKKLHQDYSDIRGKRPNVKETYDASSLPALLFRVRPLLGAERHLQDINFHLEKLLDQK